MGQIFLELEQMSPPTQKIFPEREQEQFLLIGMSQPAWLSG